MVCDELGVRKGTDVTAQLHKMLLYEPGAMFKPHTDSEKTAGMFGTLVISLPSAHSGGIVEVSHNGKRCSMQTRNHEYLAWYSDVTHEVQEVITGYRWVLTYSLVQQQTSIVNSAATSTDSKLRSILANWKNRDEVGKMIYLLEHQYTDASLSVNALKNSDYIRAQKLLAACEEFGVKLYLTTLERVITGGAEEEDGDPWGHDLEDEDDEEEEEEDDDDLSDDVPEPVNSVLNPKHGLYGRIVDVGDDTITMKRIVDADGREVIREIDVEEQDIVQDDPFNEREPDDEEYEGWTGNEGANQTYWYRDTAVLLLPIEKIGSIFIKSFPRYLNSSSYYTRNYKGDKDANMYKILSHLSEGVYDSSNDPSDRFSTSVTDVCKFIAQKNLEHKIGASQLIPFGGSSWRFNDNTVSEAMLACCGSCKDDAQLSLSSAFEEGLSEHVLQEYQTVGCQAGMDELGPVFAKILLNYKGVSARYKAFLSLAGPHALDWTIIDDDLPNSDFWGRQNLKLLFLDYSSNINQDANTLVELACSETRGFLLKDIIIPALRQQVDNKKADDTIFRIAVLSRLWEQSTFKRNILEVSFKSILELVISNFSLRKALTAEEIQQQNSPAWGYPSRSGPKVEPRMQALDAKAMATVIRACRTLDLNPQANALLTCLSIEVCTMEPHDFSGSILGCLRKLMVGLKANDTSFPFYQQLLQRSLIQFITRYVCMEPTSVDWTRNPVKCTCKDCAELNEFLENSGQQVERFAMAEKRRKHLEYQMDQSHSKFDTERTGIPFKLVVTKKGQSYQEKLRFWKKRVDEALDHISDFDRCLGPGLFRNLLAHNYDEITSLSAVRRSSPVNKLSEGERLARREKTVMELYHTLESGLIKKHHSPREEDMPAIAHAFAKVEDFRTLEPSIVQSTGINKLMREISELVSIPREDEYMLKKRSLKLLASWSQQSDIPAAPQIAGQKRKAVVIDLTD